MKQLKQFIVLAQELNFNRAAARLNMSQPPLSVSIRKFEESIGVSLFVRRPSLKLTSAGEDFLNRAYSIVAQYEAAVETARSLDSGLEGILRIAFLPSASFNVLPRIIKTFKINHSKVKLSPSSNNSENIIKSIQYGDLDIGLVVKSLKQETDIIYVSAGFERIMLAIPINHILATKERVSLSNLVNETFISFPLNKEFGFGNDILSMCKHYDFHPNISVQSDQLNSILTLVASGMGIAFVPSTSMSINIKDVQYLDILDQDDKLRYELSFIYNLNTENKLVHAFIKEIQNPFSY